MDKQKLDNIMDGVKSKAVKLKDSAAKLSDKAAEKAKGVYDNVKSRGDAPSVTENGSGLSSHKTTILARIVRLAFISVLATSLSFAAYNLISTYNTVKNEAFGETELLTISYASAISNADITENKDLLTKLFVDFEELNEYGGYGFAITDKGGIISETSCEIMKKGDNIITIAETDTDFAELSAVISAFDGTTAQQIMNIKGQKYLVGWAQIEKYENIYTMILMPYNKVMQPFNVSLMVTILIAVVLNTASVIVSVKIAHAISKPIKDASARLMLLSKGDLGTASPKADRQDETMTLLDSLAITIESLNSYINDIKNVLSGVAEGNLLVKSNAEYSGDFTEIKHALEKILDSLNGTFREVNRAAVSVKTCSVNVSDGTAVLSKNAASEAATMEELTASIADVSAKINENAEEAEKAKEITDVANKVAEQGSVNMDKMVAAISEIEETATKIELIINDIDDIAFQTNILALNAAVEAARAGDAGKGFAVVADEVRNLATKSAEAAARTGELIEASIKSVRHGTKLAGETRKSLNDVVEMVGNVSDIVSNISVSANEQAISVSQINEGMEMINGSIQHNSVTAEKNANVSEELSGQFEVLDRMLNKFKLKK